MKPYYEHGGITIYHGDCREIVPSLGREFADLVLTDPPFFMPANVSNTRRAWKRTLGDAAILAGYFKDSFSEIAHCLKTTGAFYTFSDAVSYAIFHVVLYPLFDRTQCIVWDKQVGGMGNGWRHSNELIIHGAFKDTVYAPGFRRDVLPAKSVPSGDRLHQSEKPRDVLLPLFQAHPKGRVIDPYMGSGSVLAVAVSLGWKAAGIDIDEANCEAAAKRLSQEVLPLGLSSDLDLP
jgi:site-specific DNA-methyltransferase (adenine-specific)